MRFKQGSKHSEITHGRVECYQYKIDKENITPGDIYRNSENYRVTTLFDGQDNIALMTEIQLKNIMDRLGKETVTGTDGDEFTIKDGIKVSKFSKEAMKIGFDVSEEGIKARRVHEQFTSYVGEDSVFPTKNGSPKILTKFMNHPYSYELLPEYGRSSQRP